MMIQSEESFGVTTDDVTTLKYSRGWCLNMDTLIFLFYTFESMLVEQILVAYNFYIAGKS